MIINYSDQKVRKGEKSIFLAGPTPRDIDTPSWRPEAIKILEQLNFDGIVYIPELEVDNRTFNYDNQVWWEREALYNADIIVFWIPRKLPEMPAFTTNVEYGYWVKSGKVVYGRPNDSEKNKYLDWLYEVETKRNPSDTLQHTLEQAIDLLNKK